ncbi:cytochrome c oxidase subunit 3 [Nocardia takedensis]
MTVFERERPAPIGDADRVRLPGDIHMWVMVLGDLFFFGCYFLTYMVFRARSPETFAAGQQHLNMAVGVANTVVLLRSSLLAALAVLEVRRGESVVARRLLLAAGACGAVFAALKFYEWQHAIAAGLTLSEEFFSFYYVLTGVHLLLGLLILGIVGRHLRAGARPT